MLGLEKNVIRSVFIVLAGMILLLAYSIFGLGNRLPTCLTTVKPFQKGELIKKAEGVYELHVIAKMWSFDPPEITLPPNSRVDIFLSSLDVNHGFYIENTNINLMAVPGTVNFARAHFSDPGVYHIVCHEFCGLGHQSMGSTIFIGDTAKQEFLLAQKEASHNEAVHNGGGAGQTLFQTKGCTACHSIDGMKGVGPTFKGLFGRKEKLSDGSFVVVDDAYVEESIRKPMAKIVDGFTPAMPTLPINDAEMKQLITYLKTL